MTTPKTTTEELSPSGLPVKPIPGSYGLPFFSSLRSRLDFYYFQGHHLFFSSRISRYSSTVFRVNMPPGPFLASNPRVVAVLDAHSFRILLDSSKVDKSDTLTGTYLPSLSLYAGFRPLAYLDTSEPRHTTLKNLIFALLASRKSHFVSSFRDSFSSLFDKVDSGLASSGPVQVNELNESASFDFMCEAFFGAKPSSAIGPNAHKMALKWLFFQLHPLVTVNVLPKFLEDLLLHTIHLPAFLVASDYKALTAFFSQSATQILDQAQEMGLSRDEALHNIIFATIFNAYGGVKIFLPVIFKWLAIAGPNLHARLAREVRSVVRSDNGSLTPAGLDRMDLVKSVVWESLRMDPPVEYQYGRARSDLVIESHDVAFRVKKGEMIFGYQPFATRDERVFVNGQEFVADRFVGKEGKKLLRYVVWSNGAETDEPSVTNKQCPGKDMVVTVGRLLVAEIFLRYDTFTADVGVLPLEPKITITSVNKATDG
ncbi:allene oxide synthase 4-like [Typha latifolia]|uniref:allene oxide synthase 4-like n=1 Tax=Typha latifolia TaxID=4733 RepID=UPI003C2FD1B4